MKKNIFLAVFVLSVLLRAAVMVSPGEDIAAALSQHSMITLQAGRHKLSSSLIVKEDRTIVFQNGAELCGDFSGLIIHQGGCLILEGIGKAGVLRGSEADGSRGFATDNRSNVIDLNKADNDDKLPLLIVRNMAIYGYNGIDGYQLKDDKKSLRRVEVINSHFDCREKAIGFALPELGEIRVENSTFVNCDEAIMVNCPVPGGIIVRGNIIRNFGRRGMMLGKAGQIADGCTTHLPSAIVQDNQLLGGGQRATLKDSYIQGILIYGHNISVIGNIVRDVNRGKAVPGELGQVLADAEGKEITGIRIDTEQQKHRRLAGAAIYLKANRALVQGNICTNSGWRSVIEIKTGGKEHFVSVVNNVVDGRALSQEDSFGFECNSGRSLWSGNLVYDMPNQAFVVRSGYENTFINNLIVNARVGFSLSGAAPGQGELISGNRFINVEHPVALDKNLQAAYGTDVYIPGNVQIGAEEDLPEAGTEWLGRQVLRGEKLYLCVQSQAGIPRWMELSGPLLPMRLFREIGPELALNPDQSAAAPLAALEQDQPLHRGWQMSMRSSNEKPLQPGDGHVSYDQENFQTGTQSLKVAFKGVSGNWRLSQDLSLAPGKRYRASALLRGEEPLNLRLLVLDATGKGYQTRALEQQDWQRLSVDFVTPAKSGKVNLRVWSSKTNAGKAAWLDSVSVRELQEEELDEDGKVIVRPQQTWEEQGDNLLEADFQALSQTLEDARLGDLPKGWSLSLSAVDKGIAASDLRHILFNRDAAALEIGFKSSKGNLLFARNLKLTPGARYRLSAKLRSDLPLQVVLGAKTADQKNHSAQPLPDADWQTQSFDFTVPETSGNTNIRIWANNLSEGKFIQIASMSLFELKEQTAMPE